MPKGIYQHKKGKHWKIKDTSKMHHISWNKGKKLSEEIKIKMKNYWKGKRKNEKHPNWKGGKPNCIICGKKLSTYKAKYCCNCRKYVPVSEVMKEKIRKALWKGGISKTSVKRWRQKNKELVNFWTSQRRKRLKNSEGSHTFGEWQILKAQYNYTCPICKKSEPEIKLTQDHIIPLKKGGSNNIENIQPLCGKCNSKKSAKMDMIIIKAKIKELTPNK